jgi:hypothetical protein
MKRFIALLSLVLGLHVVFGQTNEQIFLSGKGLGNTVTWDFYCSAGRNSGKWGKIEVPSQWELQGYGEYTYGRWYIKKGNEPSKETGIYRHSFRVPDTWKGKRINIVFEGVMTDTEVEINGKLAGEKHQGGFYRFSFDISNKVLFNKQNRLEVKVAKHSENESVNGAERRADWWLFGGIYRPVYLEALPAVSIDHAAIDAKSDGVFNATVGFNNLGKGYAIRASLTPLTGKGSFEKQVFELADAKQQQTVSGKWDNVIPWNPENPQLYVLTLELLNDRKQVVHIRSNRIGFRTVEFRPKDGIYVNSTRIIMKGINRHSFYPDGGRTTNREISLKDALLIKEMNMNAVRCHYPPDEHFLDMCDSLGLFLVDELAGWQNAYDTPTGKKLQKEMLMRDVNHPCIVLWSNGNEGGWNYELDKIFADYDPQKRHVIHPWADFDNLDTHHYPAFLTGVARFTNGYKVFMPTEFMHGMYDQGHGAGLEDFWNNYTSHPLFAGGFMWDFCDNAVRRTDKNGILDSENFNAPDGIVGPYREKEGSFYTVREVWAPLQFRKLYITPSFRGEFTVSNTYLFTNLSQCRMEYHLYVSPSPLKGGEQTQIGSGLVKLPELEPGETGKARMQVPDNFFEADVLALEAFDKYGKSICTWTWPIHYAADYLQNQIKSLLPEDKASYMAYDTIVELRGGDISIRFSKNNGKICQIRNKTGEIPLNNGPVAVGMKIKYDNYKVRMDGNDALFVARYYGGIDSIVWRMKPSGLLMMNALMLNRTNGGGGFDDAFMDESILNFGITFSFPERNVSGMRWMGRGPYRVWKNRIKGTNYGIWHKDYNNTITGESLYGLTYPEFKGYHANLYWAKLESKTTPFSVYSGSDGLFFRVFTPQEPEGRQDGKNTMPDFPSGDISFLYDIPAIRCFKPVAQHGPQSQPGNIRIKKGDEGIAMNLMFDFR